MFLCQTVLQTDLKLSMLCYMSSRDNADKAKFCKTSTVEKTSFASIVISKISSADAICFNGRSTYTRILLPHNLEIQLPSLTGGEH